MNKTFEYRVCQVQRGHVIHVNGKYLGSVPLGPTSKEADVLNACPQEWDYLQTAGSEGWELVSVASDPNSVRNLYLRRDRS